jgi:tetratricopeptide (TPR) repeat protein
LAQIRLQQGRTKDAIQLLKQAELFSRDPRVTLEIAGLYQQSGQTDLALSTYDSLMKTFPDAYPVLLGKAITLKSAGRLQEAQDLYTKALAKAPDNAKADVINIFTKTQVVTKTPVTPAK